MKMIKKSLLYLCVYSLALTKLHALSEHIVIENLQGEYCLMEIAPQTSFVDVIEILQSHLPEDKVQLQFATNVVVAKASKKIERNYYSTVTQQEKNDIYFIVKTLANDSLLDIKKQESSLKKAGKRIDTVHPLQFLGVVFTDEELKVAMHNLQGRSWVWKKFIGDLTDTLKEENKANNVLPFANDFAQKISLDPSVVKTSMKDGKWDKFVNLLIDKVPRGGDADRYKM